MRLGLWKKLAIAMISATVIILALALYLSQQSVKTGFLAYINNTEESRIQALTLRLLDEYEFHGSWRFIEDRPRKWAHLINRSRPRLQGDANQKQEKPYPLHDLANRDDNQRFHTPPFPPHGRDRERMRPEGNHPKPPPMRRNPESAMSLLDAQKNKLVSNGKHSEHAIDKSIHFEDEVIGYIRIEPFKKITKELDKEFINHQLEAFLKIALVSLLFILSGTWFVGRYLKRRFSALEKQANELTAGNYAVRAASMQSDELGRLANHLDTLATTLEKNQRSRQQWIADISHELRTPLSILKGETEALIDGIRPLNTQAVHSLASEIERLNHLVEDLYQLSLSDVGALNYKKEPIEVAALLEDVLSSFSTRLAEHDLKLAVDLDHCQDIEISGDSARLTQLFINLLENAIRYTNQGGKIVVSGHCKSDQLKLIIEDSAPTVAIDKLPYLFERLYRTESSRNRTTGGAGLGLAICKEIITAHQGHIAAKRSDLGGIAIHMVFPII